MSVDTFLKGKNTRDYHVQNLDEAGVKVLVAPGLVRVAKAIDLDVTRFLLWRSFEIDVEPKGGPPPLAYVTALTRRVRRPTSSPRLLPGMEGGAMVG